MKRIIFSNENTAEKTLYMAGQMLTSILVGEFSLEDWRFNVYSSVPGVHIFNWNNRIGKRKTDSWFEGVDLANFQLFIIFNEKQWKTIVTNGIMVTNFLESFQKLKTTSPKGMRFFLTQNGILAWHASEVMGYFSNSGELRRLCASDEFKKVSPNLQEFKPVGGDIYPNLAMMLGRLEPELTREEYFNKFLRNEETDKGNVIEDYDVAKHQVLIRCQQEDCNCTGWWWESARFYFPEPTSSQDEVVKAIKARRGCRGESTGRRR